MHIIVVRHYKTEKNVSNKIMGWGNSPPAKGWRKDLDFVEAVFRDKQMSFAAIYSSELERAKRTGMHFAKSLGHQKGLIYHTAELNEIDYGDCSDRDKSWVEKNVREYKTDPDYIFPNGESFRNMQRRSINCLNNIALKYEDQQAILVVVHAGVIRGLVSHYLQLPYEKYLKTRTSHSYIGDFEFQKGRFVNYTEYGKPSEFQTIITNSA